MRTNKVIIVTEEFSCAVTLPTVHNATKEEFIHLAENSAAFKGKKILDVVDGNTHHICKYCGGIARGIDADVLCDECRMDFGHAFYSEL